MSRNGEYSHGKRQREAQQARKKQEKAARCLQNREQSVGESEMTTAEEIVGGLPSIDEAMRAIENRATAPRSAASIPCRLFVGGIGPTTSEQELRTLFAEFGTIIDAVILKDRGT